MKKIISVMLVAVLVLSVLVGCGNSGSGSDSSSDSGEKKMKIAMTQGDRTDQFMSGVETAVKNRCEELGIDFTAQDAQKDVQKQIDQINTFVQQGADVIITIPCEPNVADAMISAAGDTPIIFVNRLLDEADEGLYAKNKVVGVGSDESQAGSLQAEYLSELFEGKTELNVAVIMGTMGMPATNQRTDSALSGLAEKGFKVNEVFKDTADWDRAKSMDKIQQFLGTGKPVDVIISNNDEMALGAVEALKAVGKTTSDVAVVGIDATKEATGSIEAGALSASVFQDQVGQGAGAVDVAKKIYDGEDVENITWIPFELVTKDNVKDYIK
ncbi:MAG: substrate-binding domain-containing protein [Clostridiales Family XIII bacterium]|nr:substrate-binding domain-containing protein [Clostridiales Family XIII bacterium]